jgi:hypothetical protein
MFCACMSLLNYQRLTKPAESEYIKMKTRAPKKLLSLCTTNNLSPITLWARRDWARRDLVPILTWARWSFIQTWKYSPKPNLSPQRPCTNTNLRLPIFYSTWKYSPQKRTEAARCMSKKLKPSNFPKVAEIWFASRVMIFVKSPIESGKLFNEWERKELQAET